MAPAERASSANSCSRVSSRRPGECGCTSSARSPPAPRPGSAVGKNLLVLAVVAAGGRGGAFAAARAHAYVARRHDGGDGVLVHHLAHRVAQQHDELVEAFDRALQLDAVDEVHRYRHAFAAEGIEEGILQGLSFGHGCGLRSILLGALLYTRRRAAEKLPEGMLE